MPSNLLKNSKSGSLTTRNDRDIRKFPGDTDYTIEGTPDAPGNVNNVITGIMKYNACMKASESTERANKDTHKAEIPRSGGDTESKAQDIKVAQGPKNIIPDETYNGKGSKGISWSKTIEIVYLDKLQVWSTYSLHQYFATHPRQQIKDHGHEPVDQHQKETDNEECQGNQAEGSCWC